MPVQLKNNETNRQRQSDDISGYVKTIHSNDSNPFVGIAIADYTLNIDKIILLLI